MLHPSIHPPNGATAQVGPWPPSLRFLNIITYTRDRTPLGEWSVRRKGLYIHRTTQHRNTKTNIHAPRGMRTHDPSNQAAKTYALDCVATGTGTRKCC
jgi:hypothetical protein